MADQQKASAEPEEEPQKPYQQILIGELSSGLAEFRRPPLGLFLSSLSGGLDVSFSMMLMAIMHTLVVDLLPPAGTRLVVANLYSVGFIFVVIGRSELFTEHTSRAIFPVLNGSATWGALARLWSIVYVGNLVGIFAFSALTVFAGPRLEIIDPAAFGEMARPLAHRTWSLTIISGVLAGWLMGLMAWLVTACRETISQIVIVWMVASSIGLANLPHAMVGSAEVLAAVLSDQGISWPEFAQFLLLTTLGNGLGGGIFVAALKYGHSTRGVSGAPKVGR